MLIDNSPFNKVITLGQMALSNNLLRHEAISNNVANVDTPFYKRKMVTFESELNRILDNEKKVTLPFKTNHSKHIPYETKKNYTNVTSHVFEEFDNNFRNDKNNVDIEKEVSDLIKNNLHFEAVTKTISDHFVRIKSVLA